MAEFRPFDGRGYRTVGVRAGYAEWAATYEATVLDAMDLELLDGLAPSTWDGVGRAADLGCGTGRTGAWLRGRGVAAIDGVDLTQEMLERARTRGAHDRLVHADVSATGLDGGAYGLVIASLIDEHLAALEPLYEEAFRLSRAGGAFVLVGLHPHFIMAAGMPTHFDSASGEPVAIETHVHLLSSHAAAALGAGWELAELRERVVDEAWLALKPKWSALRGHPLAFAFVWTRPG